MELGIGTMDSHRRTPGWIGRRDREPVTIPGRLVLPGGRSIPVTVRDVTPEGCRVQCEETLPIGATVTVEFGGSTSNAHVRWALGGEAGLQLVE
jgi:hypothetical protein